jgi:hypothetical protein
MYNVFGFGTVFKIFKVGLGQSNNIIERICILCVGASNIIIVFGLHSLVHILI